MTDIEPGTILTGASGAEYVIGEAIGLAPEPGTGCDAHLFERNAAPSYGPDGACRCVVCPRCGHHTGNSNQGHYWKACKVLSARFGAARKPGDKPLPFAEVIRRTSRDEFHICCSDPAYGCELEPREEISCA